MKSLFKNSLYNIIYKLFMIIFPLISSAYVSRILLPMGVGKVAYAQNIASYFITAASLGVGNYGIREIGKKQKNKEEYSKTVVELLIITLFSTLICSAFYYGMVSTLPYFQNSKMLYYVVGIQLLLTAANVDWFYQGMEEYKYITVRSLIVKILTLLGIFVFVKKQDDTIAYALFSSIALAGNNIINVIHLRKYLTLDDVKHIELAKHIKPLFILLSTGFAVELYTKLDTTTLGIMTSEEYVGYYNYATKISSIVVGLAASVSTILLPRFSLYREQNKMEELKKTIENAQAGLLYLSIPACVGLALLSKYIIIFLFGADFLPAVLTVQILTFLVVIKSIGNLYGVQILVAFGKEKILFYTTVLGAISNIIMNLILIPAFRQNGAAIASVISEFVVCLYQFTAAQKLVHTKFDKMDILKILLASTGMAIIVILVETVLKNEIIVIILSCILGVLFYTITTVMMKVKTAGMFVGILKSRIGLE